MLKPLRLPSHALKLKVMPYNTFAGFLIAVNVYFSSFLPTSDVHSATFFPAFFLFLVVPAFTSPSTLAALQADRLKHDDNACESTTANISKRLFVTVNSRKMTA